MGTPFNGACDNRPSFLASLAQTHKRCHRASPRSSTMFVWPGLRPGVALTEKHFIRVSTFRAVKALSEDRHVEIIRHPLPADLRRIHRLARAVAVRCRDPT